MRHRAAGRGPGHGLWASALGSWVRAGQKSGALGSPRGSIEDVRQGKVLGGGAGLVLRAAGEVLPGTAFACDSLGCFLGHLCA